MIGDGTIAIIIIFSLLILFIFFIIEVEAMKMDLMIWTMKGNPVLCTEDLKIFKYATYKAIHLWNNFTQLDKWKIYGSDNGCNVTMIELYDLKVDKAKGNGFTVCTQELGCMVFLESNMNNTTNKIRTITHEIGHVMSLGHFPNPETAEEKLKLGACQGSAMWWVGGCGMPTFPKDLLIALECRHGSDGFGGVINYHCQTLKWVLE